MTIEEKKAQTLEQIKVMQAFINDKTIECKNPRANDKWEKIDTPSWAWTTLDYRIKPELTYEPYNAETFFKDAVKHHFTITDKSGSIHLHIDVWNNDYWINPKPRTPYFWSDMLSDYVWADDGSPCGVLLENNE